ncbi:MAG: GspE/PulE family protein [Puniceicoccales bacterium]|jgi:type II secretory ATPase GspE/PulE/Tfp pilus assembly ATPase PilB-like protein|nr:GspE/PulE family protein [Puniceicoccales bacterium]
MDNLENKISELGSDVESDILGAQIEKRAKVLAEKLDYSIKDTYSWLSKASGLEFVEKFEACDDITAVIPSQIIHEYICIPIKQEDESIAIIFGWPPNEMMKRWMKAACPSDHKYLLGDASEIKKIINAKFGVGADNFLEGDESGNLQAKSEVIDEDEDAVIIKFVNEVIKQALIDRATDIHFEPQKNALQIRYRIDGALVPVKLPPNLIYYQAAVISRLKIMAKLNISEKRRPQDGRISFKSSEKSVDIRVSTLPMVYGESISLRLLDLGDAPVSIEDMGLGEPELKKIVNAITRPHGIVLVTGPTGSGKSTMLGACIRKIRSPEIRIITVEDPVEYEIAGINQCQVQSDIGMTFASALRSILRQDPDVVMIGEIRDQETADIAIRASITGHLVLSTLHTNDSAGAISRLVDMNLEPFMIASSLQLVVAQRLVRKLCPHCAKPKKYEEAELSHCLKALGIDPKDEIQFSDKIFEGKGCDKCKNGFRGRLAVFEVLVVNDRLHSEIIKGTPTKIIRDIAIEHGMETLSKCAWEQVKKGRTTLAEIMQFSDENNMDE